MCLIAAAAILGLRARHRAKYALRSRQVHRKVAPAGFALCLAAFATGALSSWGLREDLALAGSRHFVAACLVTSVMLVTAALSLRVPGTPWARRVHPWFGLIALVAALSVAVLGLTMLP